MRRHNLTSILELTTIREVHAPESSRAFSSLAIVTGVYSSFPQHPPNSQPRKEEERQDQDFERPEPTVHRHSNLVLRQPEHRAVQAQQRLPSDQNRGHPNRKQHKAKQPAPQQHPGKHLKKLSRLRYRRHGMIPHNLTAFCPPPIAVPRLHEFYAIEHQAKALKVEKAQLSKIRRDSIQSLCYGHLCTARR
jgi:hypothetical protein